MSTPKGNLTYVRGEMLGGNSHAVSVRTYVRDENGDEWFFDTSRFSYDLQPVVKKVRYYVIAEGNPGRGAIYRGTDGKRYPGCYNCGLPLAEHGRSSGERSIPRCPENYQELLDKLVIKEPESSQETVVTTNHGKTEEVVYTKPATQETVRVILKPDKKS